MDKPFDVVIIGAGLSGLSTAHFIKKNRPQTEMLILEKADRPGGAIQSFNRDGFLAEWGAHGFLDNVEASRELLADTGLDQEALKAPLDKFVRYICLNGRLALIPQNPKKIITSSLLSLPKKFRVLADLWKKPLTGEQSVSDWAAYRFGKGVLPFVDAVFTGTYAGDIERLSIDAVMPGIRRLEQDSGSVIRGLLHKLKTAKKKEQGTKRRLPAMISFPQGMARLPEVLAQDKNIICNASVTAIKKLNTLWEVQCGPQRYRTKTLVLALAVNQSLALLEEYSPPVARIPEARINNVVLAFRDNAEIPFGFGYLAPAREKRFALGALFSCHMFPGRVPPGHVMLEALVGGRREPEKLALDDAETIAGVLADLKQLIHLPEPPCFAKVLRPEHSIPQLEKGYPGLLAWRNELQRTEENLYVCGFGWEGIGINDMTKAAKRVAESVNAGTAGSGGKAEVKGVYF